MLDFFYMSTWRIGKCTLFLTNLHLSFWTPNICEKRVYEKPRTFHFSVDSVHPLTCAKQERCSGKITISKFTNT